MPAETKDRIVGAGAELFRRQGYTGTGVKQIVAEANAPFGSLYHFFPGGKEELGAATIRHSGAIYGELIDAFFLPAPDVVTAVEDFFAGAITSRTICAYIPPDQRITSAASCSLPPGKKWYSEPNGAFASATICFTPVPV